MNNIIFLENHGNKAKCRYCDELIEYNYCGGRQGWTHKKCPGCGKINGVAIDMTGDVVTFKVGKDEKSN